MFSTDPKYRATSIAKDPEAVVRMVSRAVIRRVQVENPGAFGGDLRVRISAANPFASQDENVKQIWLEEVTWVLQSYNFNLN